MIHNVFQVNQSIGSGVEDFLKTFTIYGCGGHSLNIFSFPQCLFTFGPLAFEEMFETVIL